MELIYALWVSVWISAPYVIIAYPFVKSANRKGYTYYKGRLKKNRYGGLGQYLQYKETVAEGEIFRRRQSTEFKYWYAKIPKRGWIRLYGDTLTQINDQLKSGKKELDLILSANSGP